MFERVKGILSPDNSFFQFARKLIWVFGLNVLFVLTSLPIVTMGASMTAMNTVFMKLINEKAFSTIKDYFKSFKDNFIKSTVVWVGALVIGFVLYVDIFYWVKYGIADGDIYGYVMLVISSLVALFFVMVLHTIFPMISRFDMSYKELVSYAVIITARDCLYCIEAVLFTTLIVGFSCYMILTGTMLMMFYMALICFGLNGLVQSYIFRRVLNKYSEEYVEMAKRIAAELKQEQQEKQSQEED